MAENEEDLSISTGYKDGPIQLRIRSRGTGRTTVVEDVRTGRPINGVKSIRWQVDSRTSRSVCTIEFWRVQIDPAGGHFGNPDSLDMDATYDAGNESSIEGDQ